MKADYIETLAELFHKYHLYSNEIGMQEFLDEYKERTTEETSSASTETQLEGAVEVPEQVGDKRRGRPRKEVRV